MFAIKDADNDNILIRHAPDNEWFSIYRKTSLPSFDFSVNNCVSGIGNTERDEIHTTNDLAYSISIEEKEYVLPTEWLQKLENK